MRIAIAGIYTESCTFSPLPSSAVDFTLHRGDAFLNRYPFLDDYDAEFVPMVWARALPGGSVEADLYQQIKADVLNQLREKGPFDGVYLERFSEEACSWRWFLSCWCSHLHERAPNLWFPFALC